MDVEGIDQPIGSDTSTAGFIEYQHEETIRPAVDIVFISSFQGQSEEGPSAWKSFHWYWPGALVDSLPNARVLVWCIPPDVGDLTTKKSINETSRTLLDNIKQQRVETNYRPLLFVAHSLGGLILQRALLSSEDNDNLHFGTLQNTKGICFFGTPQAGNGDTWRHVIISVRRALAARALVSLSPRTAYEFSEDDDIGLYSRAFRRLVNKSRIPILTFYETVKTPTNRGEVLIVGRDYAKLQAVNEQLVSRHTDHANIAKFDNSRERGYRIVCDFVLKCVPDSVAAGLQHPFVTGQTTFMSESQVDNSAQRTSLLDSLRFDWLPEQEVADWVPGTCDWILDTDEWKNWQLQSSEPLWISGEPGMGKSVLARYILRELREGSRLNINPKHVFGYFFDSRVEARQEFDGLVRALLYRFLSLDSELFRHVRPNDFGASTEVITKKSRLEILTSILADSTIGETVLLLEGLDECAFPTENSMVQFIQNLKGFSKIRLIITCRLEKSIEDVYKPPPSFSIKMDANSEHPRSSIGQYVIKEISLVLGDKGFPFDFLESLKLAILGRHAPTFLWVRLAIRYIELQRTTFLSRVALQKLPDSPDVFPLLREYLLTDHLFERIPFPSMYIVMESHRPLSISALSFLCAAVFKDQSDLLKKDNLELVDVEESTIRNFNHEIKRFPFLQVQDDLVSLMHNTLKDVLKHKDMEKIFNNKKDYDTSLGRMSLTQDIIESAKKGMNSFLATLHYLIAELCLKYLLLSLKESLDPLDFQKYASLYWFEHVRQASQYLALSGQDPKRKTPESLIRAIETLLGKETCKDWSAVPRKTVDTLYTKWIRKYGSYTLAQDQRLVPLPNNPDPKLFVFAAFDLFDALGSDVLPRWSMESMTHKDKRDHTALHFIVANNCLASLKWIQKQSPLDQFHSTVMPEKQTVDRTLDRKQSPVYVAVEYGNKEMVELFIRSSKDGPLNSQEFLASLHTVAASKGHTGIFLALYNSGFLELLAGKDRQDLAYSAVQLDCVAELNQLMANPKNTSMPSNEELLRFAIQKHAEKAARTLIPKIEDLGKPSREGRTVLHEACEAGEEELTNIIVEILERRSVLYEASEAGEEERDNERLNSDITICRGHSNPKKAANCMNVIDSEKQSALHLASQGGYLKICQTLLNHGARVNLVDKHGSLPIHLAAKMGRNTVIDLLIQHGSNLYTSDDQGRTPLHLACEEGYESTTKLLLEQNARHRARDAGGRTPLHFAVKTGKVSIVWMLIDAGADIHVRDDKNITPLHLAAAGSSDIMLAQLLSLGADPSSQDQESRTPLHYAVFAGHLRNTALLIEAGADVQAKDKEDITPLHLAAEGPSDGVVTELLRAGADPQARDDKQKSMYYYCLRNRPPSRVVLRALMASEVQFDFLEMGIGNQEMRDLLKEFGAQVINMSPDSSRASTNFEITGTGTGIVGKEQEADAEGWDP